MQVFLTHTPTQPRLLGAARDLLVELFEHPVGRRTLRPGARVRSGWLEAGEQGEFVSNHQGPDVIHPEVVEPAPGLAGQAVGAL